MAAIANSVSELGIGAYDGELKMIQYGTERQSVRWHAGEACWFTAPRPTIKLKDSALMGLAPVSADWTYVSSPKASPGTIGMSGFGWTPQAIHSATAAYAAGLVLMEKIDWLAWAWSGSDNLHVATVFFDLNPDDVMSTLISSTAGSHIGTELTLPVGVRKMATTGWRRSDIPTPTKAILAPHLYCKSFSGAMSGAPSLEFLQPNWCWKGDPTP